MGHAVTVSMTYISRSSDFALYLGRLWCMYMILLDYDSVWPQSKCRSLLAIFHGPVIVPYTLQTISCLNIIIWDYESVWPDAWPQNKCRSLWPIFHGPVILCFIFKTIWWMNISLGDYGSIWPDVWAQNKSYVTLTYISWSTDFALYLRDYLMDECHIFR